MNKKEKEIKNILSSFKTTIAGLDFGDVSDRLEKYGLNELPKEKHDGIFKIFFKSFCDPIIYVLIVAAVLSFIGGESLDALAILLIILIDGIVSTIQEYRAGKNSEALKNLIKVMCTVIRNEKKMQVESSMIVPGDIVVLESGDKICADLRLIESNNLTVDESILTGESISVSKDANNYIDASLYMVYAGTSVLTGRAKAVCASTGINTELGKIAQKVSTTAESKSPLTVRMEKFSKQISMLIIAVALVIGGVLFFKNYEPLDIFLSVVALSVSAMPEGLPLALTMALTIGSNRMGKRNVIVKKLNSVESLGSCTVIASDKTGTLTVNEQTAKIILLPNGGKIEIDGYGYKPDGKVKACDGTDLRSAEYVSKLGMINNEAAFEKKGRKWVHQGDSIDVAFLVLAHKLGVNDLKVKKIHEIPYESEKKYSAVFYNNKKQVRCTVKGSVETVLSFCNSMYDEGKEIKLDKKIILEQNEKLASLGYRVIAICDGEIENAAEYSEEYIKKLCFVGLVGFIDPVRKEALTSVNECKKAGIKVIMITGDHALTAYAIAKELGIASNKEEVVTGEVISKYTKDKDFDKFISDKKVFARVTPLDKLRIVESLQRQGEFVAVTGDGVNDAPALKVANIGVAMGSGTDVAKETAKMIIIDDNFTSIVSGIEEGRNAYANIRKISIMLLSCGLAEVLFFVGSIIFDLPIPLVAIQLLWLNIVTDGLQDMALSFERETDTLMHEKPRSPKESLFDRELIKQILLSGLYMGCVVFVVWVFLIKLFNFDVEIARGYVLMLMVFLQNMHVLNCRSEKKSVFVNGFRKNPFVLFTIVGATLLQIVFMEVPVLAQFLQTSEIPFLHLIILFFIAVPVILVMEIYKFSKKEK